MTDTDSMAGKLRVGDLYWRKVGSNGWTLGKLCAFNEDTKVADFGLVDEDSGDMLRQPPETIDVSEHPLYPANPLFSTCADMTSLHHLHEAALVKNLQDRSALSNQRPYTFMANVLIAINPLRYLEEVDKELFIGKQLDKCPPHPYHVAESAYRQLCTLRPVMQNQSIIISGESGSGKTETSKIILDFLTVRAVAPRSDSFDDHSEPEVTTATPPARPSLTRGTPSSRVLSSFSTRDVSSMLKEPNTVTLGERLMETIPILESFGNAKTHRNHNSSRFGKYMRLQFSSRHYELTGASIDTYLLEKSRLVHPPNGERNFHIFYELLRSRRSDLLTLLHLEKDDPEALIASFHYLNRSSCTTSDLLDDGANFAKLTDALLMVGIDHLQQTDLFRLVGGLLHLGNVAFDEEETTEGLSAVLAPSATASLEAAADLLGVPVAELSSAMLNKRITRSKGGRKNSIYYLKKDARQAAYSRDTIAKSIYEIVFSWLMRQCACALEYNETLRDVLPYIGVLDIFGFEDFEPLNRNSFEQLLINYANETLQSIFNTCIFQAEQELYLSEHIHVPNNVDLTFPFALPGQPLPPPAVTDAPLSDRLNSTSELITYVDNQECLNLIASRQGGVFATIDTVSRLPGPSDRKLNERLHTLFKRNSCFPLPHPKEAHEMFCIVHYAGTVKYHIESFIDKNNNIISAQFEELIEMSRSRILSSQPAASATPSSQIKGGSVSQMFSVQMKGLASELEGTRCNFIRCIKPNAAMAVGVFDRNSVVDQLRCSGTVQACSVLRVGLPTRILYAEVVDIYAPLVGDEVYGLFKLNERLFTQAICAALRFPPDAYRLGDTRLFFRTGKIDLLDQLLNVTSVDPAMPKLLGRYVVKRRWISAVTKVLVYKHWERIYFDCKFRRSAIALQCAWRQHRARRELASLQRQYQIALKLQSWFRKLQIMKAFAGRPEEKLSLLHGLLAKPALPKGQKWLLTWLGPLQRAMYVQKLCRKACVAFLVKRGFLWLYETVRKKRAQLLLQTQIRVLLAKRRLQELVRKRRARDHWKRAILGARVSSLFLRQYRRVHLERLEKAHDTLTAENAALAASVAALSQELAAAQQQRDALEAAAVEQKRLLEERAARIQALEAQVPKAKESLLSRVFRFFTCNSAPYDLEDDDDELAERTVSECSSVDDPAKPTPPSSTTSTASTPSPATTLAAKHARALSTLVKPARRQHEGVWKISRFVF
ncbi:myosin-like protein [Achlya hypogyna]|uniref:Myosin-like protein n=1 Tax=Achlya hypogyna TaxID=1202772 RepID=A0A1V9ZM06_ACHHY|nr:myosin-like protein [Achlya hypogyna]